MLTFRNTTIIFFIMLFTLNILGMFGFPLHYYHYILLVALYLALSVSMSFFIRSGYHMKALCNMVTEEKMVSITFDDGPNGELTPKLLDQLKNIGIPATFFCIGRKIKGNEDLLKRMHSEGHLIGTHSYSHSNWFDLFSPSRMRKELEISSQAVFEATCKKPLLFRPPYGVINPMLKRALHDSGVHVIGFSNRAWDTSSRKKEIILARVMKNLKPGDIILLHDTVPETIDVINNLVEQTKQDGYRIVPLDKLLNIHAYEE
ncbi:MAG: polysaccharide deacetylase family protein [Bacteroidetes bacterium]|nr:MAG: polysaccharide deacetylase family protein [Bacteroidota bacterium]